MTREERILSCYRLVWKVATWYVRSGVPIADMAAAGMVGLCEAADHYDESRGYKFSTMAVPWIRKSILNEIHTSTYFLHVPRYLVQENREGQKWRRHIPEYRGLATKGRSRCLSRLDQPSMGKPFPLVRYVVDPAWRRDCNYEDEDFVQLEVALGMLTPRSRDMITSYYGLDGRTVETLQSIGRRWKLTRERVRQLLVKALNQLRVIMGVIPPVSRTKQQLVNPLLGMTVTAWAGQLKVPRPVAARWIRTGWPREKMIRAARKRCEGALR